MANGKATMPPPSVAYYDFYKTNGLEHPPVMPVGASMTRQEFAAECDINTIMKQYDAYLADPMRSVREASYVDFTDLPDDLMGFMQVMKSGEEAFMTLPAPVRLQFENDALQFVEFASDPGNLEQMREWGLARPAEPSAPASQAPAPGSPPAPVAPPAVAGGASTHAST